MKDKILKLTKMQGFHTVLEFFSILYELSIADRRILVSNQYDTKDTVRTSKSRRIAKVCEYIEENIEEPIRLGDVAQLVSMSESAFSHFFKKKTNCTFIDYVTNLRIARACQLLSETTHTVAEICYTCGFNNLSNFIRIFKKKKGSTPQEYRMFAADVDKILTGMFYPIIYIGFICLFQKKHVFLRHRGVRGRHRGTPAFPGTGEMSLHCSIVLSFSLYYSRELGLRLELTCLTPVNSCCELSRLEES